jgi:hypothetical protein
MGGAVVAVLVLAGGVAFGFALKRHDDGRDAWHGPMSSGQPAPGRPGGEGWGEDQEPATPPGDGYGFGDGDQDGPGGMMNGPSGPMTDGRTGGAFAGGLHGQMVVPDGNGYATVAMQRGTVSSASASSLTVRSSDGYTATYRLTDATQVLGGGAGDLSAGDAVSVMARGAKPPFTAQVVAIG